MTERVLIGFDLQGNMVFDDDATFEMIEGVGIKLTVPNWIPSLEFTISPDSSITIIDPDGKQTKFMLYEPTREMWRKQEAAKNSVTIDKAKSFADFEY